MEELIATENAEKALYEKLLLERAALRKEAAGCLVGYMREFGEQITAIFKKKVDCISKKKSIAFCQQAANHGRPIDAVALQQHLKTTMAEYQEQLQQMLAEYDVCRTAKVATEHTVLQVKTLYRKIAKQIHPDMNPAMADNAETAELWTRVAEAYEHNDLDELQKLDVLVQKALKNAGGQAQEIEIPDLKQKIEKIRAENDEIKSTDPYQYKFLLDDPVAIATKKQELQRELDEYLTYEKELAKILQGFLQNGVTVPWTED